MFEQEKTQIFIANPPSFRSQEIPSSGSYQPPMKRNPKSGPEEKKCSNCKKLGHDRDSCWWIHPHLRPKSWKVKDKLEDTVGGYSTEEKRNEEKRGEIKNKRGCLEGSLDPISMPGGENEIDGADHCNPLKKNPDLMWHMFRLFYMWYFQQYNTNDWAGSFDKKLRTGYCTFVGGNIVTWKSKKQNVVARSSAEAEYRAMASTTSELTWIKQLLADFGIMHPTPIKMFCDNQAARHIAWIVHERTKHIEVDCHFIREKIQSKEIETPFVRSEDQLADIFTKGLEPKPFENNVIKLVLIDIYAPNLRGSVE